MSPEQARGKAIDNARLWAFGCVLFEMISGRHPFAGETTTDTMAAILERDPAWFVLPQPPQPASDVCWNGASIKMSRNDCRHRRRQARARRRKPPIYVSLLHRTSS